MPAQSKAQAALFRMALAHKKGKPLKDFDVSEDTRDAIRRLAHDLSEKKLREFTHRRRRASIITAAT